MTNYFLGWYFVALLIINYATVFIQHEILAGKNFGKPFITYVIYSALNNYFLINFWIVRTKTTTWLLSFKFIATSH